MKKSTCIAALFAAGLGALAVAGAGLAMSAEEPASAPAKKPDPDRHACFDPSHVDSFQTVNDHTMIIISNFNEAYELTLAPACIGVDTSFRIGIKSRGVGMNDVCGPFDAEIVYSDMGGLPLKTCPIQNVRHLSAEETATYGVKPRASKPKSN